MWKSSLCNAYVLGVLVGWSVGVCVCVCMCVFFFAQSAKGPPAVAIYTPETQRPECGS